jgi:hypothetical protein
MSSAAKIPPDDLRATKRPAKARELHDVTNAGPSIKTLLRRPIVAVQPAAGTALQSRHHVSPHSQA